MQFIHLECLKKWLKTKKTIKKIDFIKKNENILIFSIEKIKCELCKEFFPEIIKHKNKIYNLFEFSPEINLISSENKENFIVFESISENENFNLKIVFKFKKNDEILIGRCDDCNLIINDITISRIHFKLFFSDVSQNLNLIDLNSKFGTLILLQNPKIEIIKNLPLNVQINKIVFNFVCKEENFFCCDANVEEFNTNYAKLNRKFVKKFYEDENKNFLDEDEKFSDENYNENYNNENNFILNRSNSLINVNKNYFKVKNNKKFVTEKIFNENDNENNKNLLINDKKLTIKTNKINENSFNNNNNN